MNHAQGELVEFDTSRSALPTRPATPAESSRDLSTPRRIRIPVHGWRAWRLVEWKDGPVLLSTTFATMWPGPVFTADRVPAAGPATRRHIGAHGIYAFDSTAGLDNAFGGSSDAVVFGRVTLYGRVAVHEHGYRAEHCRIDRLYLAPCGAHPVIPCDCRYPGPLLIWLIRQPPCRRAHELRLNGSVYHARGFGPWVRHAYCRCRLSRDRRLSDARIAALAAALAARYQCDVATLPVGGRSIGSCSYLRPVRTERRPHSSTLHHQPGGARGQDR